MGSNLRKPAHLKTSLIENEELCSKRLNSGHISAGKVLSQPVFNLLQQAVFLRSSAMPPPEVVKRCASSPL